MVMEPLLLMVRTFSSEKLRRVIIGYHMLSSLRRETASYTTLTVSCCDKGVELSLSYHRVHYPVLTRQVEAHHSHPKHKSFVFERISPEEEFRSNHIGTYRDSNFTHLGLKIWGQSRETYRLVT